MLSLGVYIGFVLSSCMHNIRNVALFSFQLLGYVEKKKLKKKIMIFHELVHKTKGNKPCLSCPFL